jgi:hypothetical protein
LSDLNSITQPLDPINGVNSSTVAVGATGVALAVLPDNGQAQQKSFQYDCFNSGATLLAIAFANTAALALAAATIPGATPGAYVLGPGERRTLTVRGVPLFACASAAGPVYVTPGNGRA